ncbi:D-3-phosphoglycerate dehydrogenase [Escherichia coli]|uniref:D-3-phosphoglycerate dehydrogenase n=1 Tax=Escherichia coli TaxID=562 RepID=A0A376UHT6_ECOLX|nr:D-3-phosphoglycerate dehydrogenase [Escherichia coli]
MMGAKEISLMKPGSLLINASRGTVVDIPALCDALASKHLAGGGNRRIPDGTGDQ